MIWPDNGVALTDGPRLAVETFGLCQARQLAGREITGQRCPTRGVD